MPNNSNNKSEVKVRVKHFDMRDFSTSLDLAISSQTCFKLN